MYLPIKNVTICGGEMNLRVNPNPVNLAFYLAARGRKDKGW